jgi:hypothetical protein
MITAQVVELDGTDVHLETAPCPYCHKSTRLIISDIAWGMLQEGRHIQQVLPGWPAPRRELLMTGFHPDCWDEMFVEDKED